MARRGKDFEMFKTFSKMSRNSSLSTEKAGVDVWPNVSLTRDELRSKVTTKLSCHFREHANCEQTRRNY